MTNGGVELPEVNGFHEETDALESGQVIKRKLDDAETPIKRKKKRKSKEVAVIKETNGQELEPQITELLKEEKLAENGSIDANGSVDSGTDSPPKKKKDKKNKKVKFGEDKTMDGVNGTNDEEPEKALQQNGKFDSSEESDDEIDLMKKTFSYRLDAKTKEAEQGKTVVSACGV